MSKDFGHGLDRPVGELWVELSRDEKKRICDALIDRNQPDVVQEFASLVRFTRGYLHTRPSGPERFSQDNPFTSLLPYQGAQTSGASGRKRVHDEIDLPPRPEKKACSLPVQGQTGPPPGVVYHLRPRILRQANKSGRLSMTC